MAVGDETIGFGGTLEVNDGPASAYVAVDKVVSLGVPSSKIGTVESKRLDLTARTIKKLATLKNGGTLAVKVQHTNAGYARFAAIRDSFAEYNWRVTVPDDDGDTEITVPGILTEVKYDAVEAEKISEFELMVEVSGNES